ncbi:GntR family transcriptional regulator [Variovorax sp. M-6]|uniref:GntR family transcriptional regulator n=1 Tax=Variovorax sp. M-6 TaxID=3233041 RepID=UPI003F9B03C9
MKQITGTATVAHQLYAIVKERIINGTYGPGMRLTEQQMAAEFNTSRTPVREAMRLLTADGFVVFKPNSGTMVRTWSSAQIAEIFELRVLIEGEIAGHAARHIGEDEIDQLQALQDEIESCGPDTGEANAARIGRLNREFHRVIAQASRNERLVATLANAIELPIVQRTFRSYTVDQLRRSFAQHRELIEAFQVHDAGWAQSTMSCHIHSAKHTLLRANEHHDD